MSVRVTDNTHVTFYCSTTGLAFGPVFTSELEAEAFRSYVEDTDGRDLREIDPTDLSRYFKRWYDMWQAWEPSDVEMFGAGAA